MNLYYKDEPISVDGDGAEYWEDIFDYTDWLGWRRCDTNGNIVYDENAKVSCLPLKVKGGDVIKVAMDWGNCGNPAIVFCREDGSVASFEPSAWGQAGEQKEFTIAEDVTTMYINRFCNQAFLLQRKVAGVESDTPLNNSTLLENFKHIAFANHRTFESNRKQITGQTKAFVTFGIDDCRPDMSSIADSFASKGIPLCINAIDNLLRENSNSRGESRYDICKRVVDNGGEILSHFGTPLTKEIWSDEEVYKRFEGVKINLSRCGFDVNGIILAGGTGYNTIDFGEVENWTALSYAYSDLYGVSEPYHHGRISMHYWTATEVSEDEKYQMFVNDVNNAIANKTFLWFYFHDLKECPTARLERCLDYIVSKVADGSLECGTPKEYYNKYYYNNTL